MINRRRLLHAAAVLPFSQSAAHARCEAAAKLIAAAHAQIGVTTRYDPRYERLAFPGGDVPIERGVCTDVIVRAYRVACDADLQALLNADMREHFSVYPRTWGLGRPDANIDHRRVLNLQVFFRRKGAAHPVPTDASEWQPGDVVAQALPDGRPHMGIVGATRDATSGRLLVIHNIGRGTEASDILALFKPTGRYRFLLGADMSVVEPKCCGIQTRKLGLAAPRSG